MPKCTENKETKIITMYIYIYINIIHEHAMVKRCPFLVSKFNNYTNQHCLTEMLHTKMGHLRKLYVACSPLMCNTTNLIKGYARHSMIQQQQVDKGFLLHQFYCNQFYLKNNN